MISMFISRKIGSVIVSAAFLGSTATAFAAQPVTGNWLTEENKALVRIEACGKTVCGKIVKVLKPTPGKPTMDIANPDPTKRKNPIEGTYILTDFTDAGALWKGKIYNPDSGKTYNAKLTRNPDGTLKVEGCIAFLCKGPTWQPAR
jgi:uncharacterized protein (DUF2147 family)